MAAPSGSSTAGSCTVDGFQTVSAPVPVNTVIDHLTVDVASPLAQDETFGVSTFVSGTANGISVLQCTIPVGSASCTAAGPSIELYAGNPIVFEAYDSIATLTVNFSYEMSTQGLVVPNAPRMTRHQTS